MVPPIHRVVAALVALQLAPVLAKEYLPVKACTALQAPKVEGAVVKRLTATEKTSAGVVVCDVNVYLTHGTAADTVRIQTYLPLHNYTGRFQGLGGGGMVAGVFDEALALTAGQGYAVGSTDAGRANATMTDATWAGNEQLLINFAYLSVHEMTVVGKALAAQFYGVPVEYSYWNGCSNGGRQGYEEAQRYPGDYDGVLANAPGINWDRFLVADLHPFLVEVKNNVYPPKCVWETITAEAVKACDMLDGGRDGVINLPHLCRYNGRAAIGKDACGTPITDIHADMWNEITRGPLDPAGNPVWAGRLPGTNLNETAGAQPFVVSMTWTASFVEFNSSFDVSTIPFDKLYAEVAKSEVLYRPIMGGDNPDLSGFRDAGGKLLTWHGLVDQILYPFGTTNYRLRVEKRLGGNAAVNDFYRLFMAPGVQHCGGGIGAQPIDPLSLLVDWVEKDKAPKVMPASGDIGTRNLCLFPKNLIYSGKGDLANASSWICL
ncbi:feruloyl esterase B [Hypoxylon crocopeplum]|nr:feruloyl esterase B [Hypoxylon crocopeplum]